MAISEQRRLLDETVECVSDALSTNPMVAAVWLGGSLGRGEGDALSDIDLVLVAAQGRVAELAGSIRGRLVGIVGTAALVHEAPQNAPVDGAQLNVLYDTEPLPIYVDWNVWPPVHERPADVRPLFEREPMTASEHSFQSILDEMPRGRNTPLVERLPDFRLFMVPILMKHAARGWFESVRRIVGYMQIPGDEPASFEAAKDLAGSLLLDAAPDSRALETIRRYIDELEPFRA